MISHWVGWLVAAEVFVAGGEGAEEQVGDVGESGGAAREWLMPWGSWKSRAFSASTAEKFQESGGSRRSVGDSRWIRERGCGKRTGGP